MQGKFNELDSSGWGADMVQGIANGIRAASEGSPFKNTLNNFANLISSYIHFSRPDVGPLREYEKWMPDMVKGLSKTLLDASPILENATKELGNKLKTSLNIADFNNYNGIQKQIIESNKTIFTTPQIIFNVQELDEEKLQQCFNYVNKKFGSAY